MEAAGLNVADSPAVNEPSCCSGRSELLPEAAFPLLASAAHSAASVERPLQVEPCCLRQATRLWAPSIGG
jgi:hypothetical protein